MKKILLALLFSFFSSPVIAGMGACHDGSGNITALEMDANPAFFSQANCQYFSLPQTERSKFDRIHALIKTIPKRYIKWDIEPVEMNQTEKDLVDQSTAVLQSQAEKNLAKQELNQRHLKAFIKILIDEINILRQQNSLPSRTLQQLKTAVENEIDNQ